MISSTTKAAMIYREIIEGMLDSHPHLAGTLRKAERNRNERLAKLKDGIRLKGMEEFLQELVKSKDLFSETPALRSAVRLLSRAVGYYEIGLEGSISGLHSVVHDCMRSAMEIEFLLRDFTIDVNRLDIWLHATEKVLQREFSPARLRKRYAASLGVKPEDMCEALDYKAHSKALHVSPRANPFAIPGISDDIWYQSDACFWELYEHGRRLLIATANFAHIVAPECIIKGPEDMKDFKAGWERTQEIQQLFMLMLSASNKRLETTAQGEN
jgi:hypothetical protein